MVAAPPLFWNKLFAGPAIEVNTTAVAAAPEPNVLESPLLKATAGVLEYPVPRCTIFKLLTEPVVASKFGDTLATVPA